MNAILHIVRPREQWTLDSACGLALEQHWQGTRKLPNAKSWCNHLCATFPDKTLGTLTTRDITTYIQMMQQQGLSSWTVHAKVCVISTVYQVAKANGYTGSVPMIPRPRIKKPLKWWLTPEAEQEVTQWLRSSMLDHEMADFVQWTVQTGLRVEESLRVTRGHFAALSSGSPELLVPGTKTSMAQASIAVSAGAALIACTRFMALTSNQTGPSDAMPLFTMTYRQLTDRWQATREQFGWSEISTATLKALRRSFARRMTVNGCPLPVLQQMMRHKDPETTMGYMKLVGGGFTTEEQRKWL